jgi:predicted transcriptional regulator
LYRAKPGIKNDPQRFWALPDRVFFGHGACHMLAGVYLQNPPLCGFRAERIIPSDGFWGNHIYVTNGEVAFDYHGYSSRQSLLDHHRKCWTAQFVRWDCVIEPVTFDLLDTAELNQRNMRGPNQYLFDPRPRAQRFINRVKHDQAAARASKTLKSSQRREAQLKTIDEALDRGLADSEAGRVVDAHKVLDHLQTKYRAMSEARGD